MEAIIKIDGKPIEKLIDVVSRGIGTLYRPRAIRKEADAMAYEIKVIEKAKAEALAESKLIEAHNLDRLNDRLIAKEIKRQNNIDDVVEIAAEQLKSTANVSEDIVDEDWTTRFFDIVQDVSSDDMKNLWGRILAGEVERPNSYSKRTLELLRNLSKDEAELFVKFSQYVLHQDDYFIYISKDGNLTNFTITYSNIAKLIEVGLIQASSTVHKSFKPQLKDTKTCIIYSSLIVFMDVKANTADLSIPIVHLTRAGIELYSLLDVIPNIDYMKDLAFFIKGKGVAVSYAHITKKRGDGTYDYLPPEIKL